MDTVSPQIGRTYYRVTFADRDLTMPALEPLVYIGETSPGDSIGAYIFQDTISYVRFGSRLDSEDDIEDSQIFFVPRREMGSSIFDIESAAREVATAAKRARDLNFPILPVLKSGWKSAF